MMLTDKDCAELAMGIYAYSGSSPVTWDHYDSGTDDGVCYGVKFVNGTQVVAIRGSTTLEDWIRDFDCVALPFNVAGGLGPVHPGFYLGMDRVCHELLTGNSSPYVVTGHSLGAGRACVLTGLMTIARHMPLRRVCFGEPKPGFDTLAKLIAGIPAASYCAGDANGHDLVTDVPFSFPPEEYVHPTPLTPLAVTLEPNDPWGIFAYHHMQGYAAALAAQFSRNA
jgi:hypothetical protein